MADVNIKYRNASIATMNATGSKTLGTQNKYCDSDIIVEYTKPAQAVIESNKNATPSETAQEITPSSGYDAMAKVTVGAVSSSYVGTGITRRSSTDLTESGGTVSAPAGYYENAASKAVANATWKSASTVGCVPEISVSATGLITANAAGWTSCKPLSASGYADADTSANLQLVGTKTSQLSTQAGTTITPTTSTQTAVAEGKYTTGDVLVGPIPNEYVIPTGTIPISENGLQDVRQYEYANVNVSSGASKNTQIVQGTTRTNSSTLTAIGAELTVSKTGTYDIYYTCLRTNTSSSYTWGTRLYIDGAAQGTENTTWTNNQQNTHLTNVSLTADQKLRVYGRETRGTSYYVCAPMLAIVEV